jgi:putative peptidoglycan lipid II flippase
VQYGSVSALRYWRTLRKERRFLTAVTSVGVSAFAVAAVGGLKDLTVAARFGTSDALDAYLQAFVLFLLVTNTCVSALSDAFLPAFVRADRQPPSPSSRQLVRMVITANALIMIAVTLCLVVFRQPILALLTTGFDARTRELSETLFIAITPALVLSSGSAAMLPILNVRGKLKRAALVPIVSPLLTFTALTFDTQPAIWILPLMLVSGKLIELALATWGVMRLGYSLVPGWPRGASDLLQLSSWLRQCIPLGIAGLLATGSLVIDQAVAATLGPGAVSSLSFGTRVTLAIVFIGSLSLSSFVFPEFSKLILSQQFEEIRELVKRYTAIAFSACICLTLFVVVFSEPIIRILFQRGAFTEQDTLVAQRVQMLFVLQVPFNVPGVVLVKILSALGRNYVLMVFTAIMLIVNAIADIIFAQLIGVAGIALSTSFVFVITFSLLLAESNRVLKSRDAPTAIRPAS